MSVILLRCHLYKAIVVHASHSPWHVMGERPALALQGDKESGTEIEDSEIAARSKSREQDRVCDVISSCAGAVVHYPGVYARHWEIGQGEVLVFDPADGSSVAVTAPLAGTARAR